MDLRNADRVETRAVMNNRTHRKIRNSYDSKFKLKVIKDAENSNNCKAAVKYGTSEKNVRTWRLMKEKLQNACSTRRTFRGPKLGRFPQIDEQVVAYVHERRDRGFNVTLKVIQRKAIEIARNMNISVAEFKASFGWGKRLMKRNGLTLRCRRTSPHHLPIDFEKKLLEYQSLVRKLREQHNYFLGQMGNADQTPVYFKIPSADTMDVQSADSVSMKALHGNGTMRITVMLAVLADGTKLPPYVVLKRKLFPKGILPHGVHVRCQKNGHMSEVLVKDWLHTVWNKRPGALLAQRGMLVLDASRGQTTNTVKKLIHELKTDLVIIPRGMASQLQVLDVFVHQPFTEKLQAQYTRWTLQGKHPLTQSGKIKKPPIAALLQWIEAAWEAIDQESIVEGFEKCWISNAACDEEDKISSENDIDVEAE